MSRLKILQNINLRKKIMPALFLTGSIILHICQCHYVHTFLEAHLFFPAIYIPQDRSRDQLYKVATVVGSQISRQSMK